MGKLVDIWLTGSLTILLLIMFVQFTIMVANIIEMYSGRSGRFKAIPILIAIITPLVIGGLIYIFKLL